MRVVKALVALAMLAPAPTPAAAQRGFDPIVLAPTSDWVLDYNAEYCALGRRFGTGENEVLLQIANFGRAEDYTFFFVGDLIPYTNGPSRQIQLRMGAMAEFSEEAALMGESGSKKSASFSRLLLMPDRIAQEIALRQEQPTLPWPRDDAFERSIMSIDLDFGDREITLQTGPLAPAIEAMRECHNNLLISWGIDPTVHNNLSRPPYFTEETIRRTQRGYPHSMLRVGQGAMVQFRVMVGADGSTQSCIIQVRSPDPVFDAAVCAGMEPGFEPALDAAGQPVASVFTGKVYFSVR